MATSKADRVAARLAAHQRRIDAAEARMAQLLEQRLQLWHDGRAAGMTITALAAASGISQPRVTQALQRAAAKADPEA